MTNSSPFHAWIFVSHSSADIVKVREVRNYLEAKGASPLLFHLKALQDPEEFWPLIEREIAARNFFLYCESVSAEEREWVRRERAAVEAVAQSKPVRIGRVRVDEPQVDTAALDAFVSKTRLFASYAYADREMVRPYLDALDVAGFTTLLDKKELGVSFDTTVRRDISETVARGWFLAFVTKRYLETELAAKELAIARSMGAQFICVMLEPAELPFPIHEHFMFIAEEHGRDAPHRLVYELMTRNL